MIFPALETVIAAAYLAIVCVVCRAFLWPPNRD
jgi:hypothetical protein